MRSSCRCLLRKFTRGGLAFFPCRESRTGLTRLPPIPSRGSNLGSLKQAPDRDAPAPQIGLNLSEVSPEIGHKRIIALSGAGLSSAILRLPDFAPLAHICAMGRKRIIRREAIDPTAQLTVETLYPSTATALSNLSMEEHLTRLYPRDHSPESLRKWIWGLCRQFDISPTTLAKRAKLVPSTINRFLNGTSPAKNLSADTIQKIFDYFVLEIEKEPSDRPDPNDNALNCRADSSGWTCPGRERGLRRWSGRRIIDSRSRRWYPGGCRCTPCWAWRSGATV
jgi:hypothetical protein